MSKITLAEKDKPEVLTPPDASALAVLETGNFVVDLARAVSDSEEVLLGYDLFLNLKKNITKCNIFTHAFYFNL